MHATLDGIERIDFPAYESVQRPGFDGEIVCSNGNAWVPSSHSLWELSVEKGPTSKAKKDFEKRTAETIEEVRKNATYIALTARHWRDKKKWESDATISGKWKSVRAYDCDDIEQWTEAAPAAALWLAERWGDPIDDLSDIESRWNSISKSTTPALSPSVYLTSRGRGRDALLKWFSEGGECLTVVAPFPSEVIDFVCAAILDIEDGEREAITSRMVVTRTATAVRQISRLENGGLVLLVEPHVDLATEDIAAVIEGGARIIRAREPFDPLPSSSLRLERVREHELSRALQNCGLSQVAAEQRAKDAGGSLALLKESLSRVGRPPKASQVDETARGSLRACLLLGGWDGANPADRSAVEQIAGKPYSEVEVDCSLWARRRDPLLIHADKKWRLISKGDAWATFKPYVSNEHLTAFGPLAVSILSEKDPAIAQPDMDRWLARVKGYGPKHSKVIKKELADTLALLGAFADNISPDGRLPVVGFVDSIVRQVLSSDAPWELWASLNSLVPLLAEASPAAYLNSVEADLVASEPKLPQLFTETKGHPLFSGCLYSGLLWSLETLAWAPEHMPGVCSVLLKLHRLYVPGNYGNSPLGSLQLILSCALPYTTADVNLRIGVLKQLQERDERAAWELQVALVEQFRGGMFPETSRPAWRGWAASWEQGETYSNIGKQLEVVCSSLLANVGVDFERWSELIDLLTSMPEQIMLQAIDGLEQLPAVGLDDQQLVAFREKLLDYISLYRGSGATDRIGEENLVRLEGVAQAMEPASLTIRYAPLFGQWVDRYYTRKAKYEESEADLESDRLKAMEEVLAERGFEGVCELAKLSPQPFRVGYCLAQQTRELHQQSIIPSLIRDDDWSLNFACGFISERFESDGWDWLDSQLRRCNSDSSCAWLLAMAPIGPDAWDRVDEQRPEVKRLYWSNVKHFGVEKSAEAVERCVTEMIAVGRIAHAADVICAAIYKDSKLPSDTLLAPLEAILDSPTDLARTQMKGIDEHDVGVILTAAQEAGDVEDDRLIRIEINFLRMLGDERRGKPATLFRKLAAEPDFFIKVLTWCSPLSPDEQDISDDEYTRRRAQAHVGYDLLHKWKTLPGVVNGSVDETTLTDWVGSVRNAAEPPGLLDSCDYHLGRLFSYAPEDPDGSWPTRTVRKVAETIATEGFGDGLRSGVFNSRGVVCRGEGGMQERELAAKYKGFADQARINAPFVASILDQVQQSYLGEGQYWDGLDEWER